MPRKNGRDELELRPISITRNYQKYAEGSALIKWGDTWVLCSASVSEVVPPFLEGKRSGWITAEYGMLPRSTSSRITRSRSVNSGRTAEIQRLIGRSLRAVADLTLFPDYTILVDCDVVQADGGTRTASITGAYVALKDAFKYLIDNGYINSNPLLDSLAAVSLGIVNQEILIDLDYEEDSQAGVDMNIVMTGSGRLVEIQGTAEGSTFSMQQLHSMTDAAEKTIQTITKIQNEIYLP